MPRASHFGGASRKGGNKPSTQAPPPPTDAPPATQAPPPSTNAPPVAQAPPPLIDAPPSTQASLVLIDATLSVEAPSQALSSTQTWPRRRQRTKPPSQAPPPSIDAPPSTQAPPSSIDAPSSFQALPPSIDASPSTQASPALSTEAPSQAPPATQTRLRRRQRMEAPSQAPPPSTDAPLSTQSPPPSIDVPSSSQAPSPSFDAPPFTRTSSALIDDTLSPETPSQAPPTTQTQPRSRQSTKYWTVDVKDASGVTKVAHLKLKDLWELPNGTKVVLPLNNCKQPVGEAGGLLGQALGQLGANFAALPICYKSWSKVPNNYKEEIYNSKIKEKFIINDALVKKIIIKRIGEKWKENRSDVFHKYYDSKLSREENYANHPPGITRDQWIQFIEYRLHPNTVKMCKRNAESREKLLVVHRGGSKSLARKRYEMEVDNGEPVGRGKVFVALHAKADGSYANTAAQTICEKIIHVESEGCCSQAIAPNDSLGQAFGNERSGRVRGLGLGPCKSQVFETQTQHEEGPSLNSASFAQMQQEIVDLRAQLERETKSRIEFQNAVSLVLQHVATPFMTPELAAILTPMLTRAFQATRASDGSSGPSNGSSSDRS